MTKYRYGFLLEPKEQDPVEEDISVAEDKAREKSNASKGSPVAVWDEAGVTITLFAGFERFKPVYAPIKK